MTAKPFKRRYHPQRIINPRADAQVARLNPGQALNLLLDPPGSWRKGTDAKWDVRLRSEFLKITNHYESDDGKFVYEIVPRMELAPWTELSRTFIGNIFIDMKSPVEGDVDEKSSSEHFGSVSIFLEPSPTAATTKVVTVVRPDNQIVRLSSDELLEVVLSDVPQLCWQPHCFPCSSDGKYFLELVHTEYLPQDTIRSQHNSYVCHQRLTEDYPIPSGQHHFWFRWSDRSRQECISDTKGTYPGTRILFVGKNPQSETVRDVQLRVYLYANKKSKNAKDVKIEQPENKFFAIETDFTKRFLNPNKRLLSNPKDLEEMELHGNNDTFDIEVMKPQSSLWRAEVVPVQLLVDKHSRLEVNHNEKEILLSRLEVEPRENVAVNGYTFQKFRVRPINIGSTTKDNTQLGCIRLFCEGLKIPDKKIEFKYVKGFVASTEMPGKTTTALTVLHQNKKNYSNNTSYNTSYATGCDNKKKKGTSLDYSEVEILDISPGGLSVGEITKNPFSYQQQRYHAYDCDGESEDVYLGIGGFEQATEDVKKKLENIPIGNSSGKSDRSNTNKNNATSSVESRRINGPVPSGKEKEKSKSTNTSTECLASNNIVSNPPTHSEIVVTNGQTITVEFPTKLAGFAKAVFWDFKVVKTSEQGHVKVSHPWIQGDYQKFKITGIGETLPPGKHLIGNVMFVAVPQNSRDVIEHRMLPIFLRFTEPEHSYAKVVALPDAHKMSHNTIDGRITLVDPLGSVPIKVRAQNGNQIEILLTCPKSGGNWEIKQRMMLGDAHIIDNSEWRLIDQSRHQRFLVKVEGDPISGEIGIFLGGNKQGQVDITCSALNSVMLPQDSPSRVLYTNDSRAYTHLKEGQTIVIDSQKSSTIRIAKPDKYLSTYLAHRADGLAKVNFWQHCLSNRIADNLSGEAKAIVDTYKPWEKFDCATFGGATPWESISCCFPSIEHAQPHYKEILRAFGVATNNAPVFPIGTIECDYNISNLFRVSYSYTIAIKNDNYLKDKQPHKEMVNPPDTMSLNVYDGEIIKIVLSAKMIETQQVHSRMPWRLTSGPTWLILLNSYPDKESAQTFFFYCHMPNENQICRSKLIFDCGSLVKRIELSAWKG